METYDLRFFFVRSRVLLQYMSASTITMNVALLSNRRRKRDVEATSSSIHRNTRAVVVKKSTCVIKEVVINVTVSHLLSVSITITKIYRSHVIK